MALSGPTLFSPVLQTVTSIAAAAHCRYSVVSKSISLSLPGCASVACLFIPFPVCWICVCWIRSQERQKYTVLLILTDGMINDMEATIAALVNASTQPLSVIIVGVGSENFAGLSMEII